MAAVKTVQCVGVLWQLLFQYTGIIVTARKPVCLTSLFTKLWKLSINLSMSNIRTILLQCLQCPKKSFYLAHMNTLDVDQSAGR